MNEKKEGAKAVIDIGNDPIITRGRIAGFKRKQMESGHHAFTAVFAGYSDEQVFDGDVIGMDCMVIIVPIHKLHHNGTANSDRIKYGDVLEVATAMFVKDAYKETNI